MRWIIILLILLKGTIAMGEFTNACKPYINKYGSFNQTPGEECENSGNGLLYMATYYQIKNDIGELTTEDKNNFENTVRRYYTEGYPGLLNRKVDNPGERQAHDDYEGVVNAASLFDSWIVMEIHRRGIASGWFFDNVNPQKIDKEDLTLRNYLGRHWGFVAHIYFSTKNIAPSLFERLRWIIGVVGNAFSKDGTGDTILTWHKIKAYERSNKHFTFCDKAVNIWKERLKKRFPNGMGDVFAEYYGKDHPFTLYTKEF